MPWDGCLFEAPDGPRRVGGRSRRHAGKGRGRDRGRDSSGCGLYGEEFRTRLRCASRLSALTLGARRRGAASLGGEPAFWQASLWSGAKKARSKAGLPAGLPTPRYRLFTQIGLAQAIILSAWITRT